MYSQYLKNAGLTEVQAEIYENLLNQGEAKASDIGKRIKRPRGVIYKGLDELLLLGLVEKIENKAITRFRAEHPTALEKVFTDKEKKVKSEIEEKRRRLERDKSSMLNNLSDLISAYNLSSNKPGVKYYEGEDGIWQILKDTLTSKTEILTVVDIEAVNKYIKEINHKYVIERNNLGIKKRLIVIDTPYAHDHFARTGDYTDIKLIKTNISPFSTSLQIYDNKIAYITMTEKYLTGTIINDQYIYSMQKALFEEIWKNN